MPPKQKSAATVTKPGKKGAKLEGKGLTGTKAAKKDKLADANPIKRSSQSVGRAGDLRRHRDANAALIEEERAEQQREIRELKDKIEFYKKDNEKLLRQQTAKFGLTLDNMNYLKEDLEIARTANDSLFREVESRKEECDKLAEEMDNVIRKINDLTLDHSDLLRERRIYERELEQLYENELKIQKLTRANKELKNILLRNKINPNVDASTLKTRSASPHGGYYFDRPKLPTIFTKDNLLSFRNSKGRQTMSRRSLTSRFRRTKSNSHDFHRQNNPDVYVITERRPYLWKRV